MAPERPVRLVTDEDKGVSLISAGLEGSITGPLNIPLVVMMTQGSPDMTFSRRSGEST